MQISIQTVGARTYQTVVPKELKIADQADLFLKLWGLKKIC